MSRRKAEMVLELIDRATRPARRFLAMQDRMKRAVEQTNRTATESSDQADRAAGRYRRTVQRLERAQSFLRDGVRRTNEQIELQIQRLRRASGQMGRGFGQVGRAAVLAGGMLTAYSGTAALAANSFLGPARQFENYGVQFATLEGSAEAGQRALSWVEDFATRTPLLLHETVDAFAQLRTYGMDPTNGSLMALVDAMAASGRGAEQLEGLASALGQSWTLGMLQGDNIRQLMDRGIPVYELLSQATGRNVEQLQAMASAGELGRTEIQLLIDAIGQRYAGAADGMSRTWDGVISNIIGWWNRFQRMVMGAGLFDWLKTKLQFLYDFLRQLEETGQMQLWAERFSDYMLTALNGLWDFGAGVVSTFRAIYPWIASAADAVGGWRNLVLLLMAIPLRGVLFGAAAGFAQIALGALGAGRALAAIGFLQIGGWALRAGVALLGLLNPLNWVRWAFIGLRVAFLASRIGLLVAGLAMAGLWIYNNWAGLGAFFTAFGSAFMDALGPAAPLVESIVSAVSSLWSWLMSLVGPLDASAQQWAAWGTAVGETIGGAVAAIGDFFSTVAGWVSSIVPINWVTALGLGGIAAAVLSMGSGIGSAFSAIWAGLPRLRWASLVPRFRWMSVLNPLQWVNFAARFAWRMVLTPLRWALFVPRLAWRGFVGLLRWAGLAGKLAWRTLVSGLRWASFVPRLAWRGFVFAINWIGRAGRLAWSALVTPLRWASGLIGQIGWKSLAGRLSWSMLLTPLRWVSRLIPGIGWAVLAGELLWNLLIRPLGWDEYISLDGLRAAWAAVAEFFTGWEWSDILPTFDWASIIPDFPDFSGLFGGGEQTLDVQLNNIATSGFNWDRGVELVEQYRNRVIDVAQLHDALSAEARAGTNSRAAEMLAQLNAQMQITDPASLQEASRVAAELQERFPALSAAANETLEAVRSVLVNAATLLAGADFASHGVRLVQSIAAGMRSQIEVVRAAARAVGLAITSSLPNSARVSVTVPGQSAAVQARAAGGSFRPGWLLTGEQGPELEYRTRGGFIAHNAALQGMVAMSQQVLGNVRRAALTASIASVSTAVPAAALDLGGDSPRLTGGAPSAASAPSSISLHAPISLTISGNADANTAAQIEDAVRAALDDAMSQMREQLRASERRSH